MAGTSISVRRFDGRRGLVVLAVVAIAVVLVFALSGCGGSGSGSTAASGTESAQRATASSAAVSGSEASDASSQGKAGVKTATATVKVKGYKSFDIALYGNDAPKTVANFTKLANDKYYDGLAFYRVVDKFCLQGGTMGNSASGDDSSLTPIEGEFSDNGVDNQLADKFKKGTVAMARTNDPDSATSTFFVTLDSSDAVSQSLNGKYAAFGIIGKPGMKVVDTIVDDCKGAKADANGMIANKSAMPVIESIRVK